MIGTAIAGPALAQAYLPIDCPNQTQREWGTVLRNNSGEIAVFGVDANCLCSESDLSGSFNGLARAIMQPGAGQDRLVRDAAQAIVNGGFTSDGASLDPAIENWISLKKGIRWTVNPANNSTASGSVWCVRIFDIATWMNYMRPFAQNWTQ